MKVIICWGINAGGALVSTSHFSLSRSHLRLSPPSNHRRSPPARLVNAPSDSHLIAGRPGPATDTYGPQPGGCSQRLKGTCFMRRDWLSWGGNNVGCRGAGLEPRLTMMVDTAGEVKSGEMGGKEQLLQPWL